MFKRMLTLLLCLVLFTGFAYNGLAGVKLGVTVVGSTIAEDRQKIAELQEKLDGIKNNLTTLEKNKDKINADTQTILEQKLVLDQEYTLIMSEISTISDMIVEFESMLENTATEKADKEVALEKQLDEFSTLLVELYKNGDDSKFDMFLKSDSYSSYVSYVEYMEHILKSGDAMIKDINQTITDIGEREKEYTETAAQLVKKEDDLLTAKQDLIDKQAEMDKKLGENLENVEFTDKEKAEMEKAEQDLLKEIADLQKQMQDKISASYNGKFSWPIVGSAGYITSNFGWRDNPFNGTPEYHNGLDIAGVPKGTGIRVADDGVVTYAGNRGAFGNVVFVEHGGGITTIYAHCDSLLVSYGATVKKDQVIARVGATGQVTGVHLHFAVSKNGSYVDPKQYLPTYFTQ